MKLPRSSLGHCHVRNLRDHPIAVLWLVLCAVAPCLADVPPPPGEASFDVWEYQIVGGEVLTARDVEQTVYPYLGVGRHIADVEAARAALEQRYHDRGYGTVMVNIPEQDVDAGVVRLEVLDGRVERVDVTGSRYYSLGRITVQLPALTEGQTPNLKQVQKELSKLAADAPDRRITPVLRPGRRPGAVEVELKVDDQLPLHGALELNDRYSRDTTHTRLNASLRYDNLWQREHSVGLSYETTPQDTREVRVLSGNYLFHPWGSPLALALYGVKSDSNVTTLGGNGSAVGVIGKGFVVGLRAVQPLPAWHSLQHSFTAGLDYKDFSDSVSPTGSTRFETPISYTKFVSGWNGSMPLGRSLWNFGLTANFALRGLGNTGKEFADKRFTAQPDFFYLQAEAQMRRAFARGELHLRLAAQASAGALVSNEQLSLGGEDSVRGYVETEALADDGLAGSLEFTSLDVTARLGASDWGDLRWFAFFDAAAGYTRSPLPRQAGSVSLAALGLGLRLHAAHGVESSLAWAMPLISDAPIHAGDSRLHFNVVYEF